MAEAGFAGAAYAAAVSPGSSVTYYGNYGNSAGAALGADTTEANVELVHRGANATLKNLRVVVATNARAATSSVTTRKNNADTAQVATITASTTGTYTDLTNTVSVTAGDKVAYKLVIGSTSGNFVAASITVNTESSSQAANFWSAIGSVSTTNASSTRYWNVTGALATPSATEANFQSYLPAAGTISNLRCYVTAARATNTTFKSRVGGADGAMSVTLTASTTGAFEDTTNSDTVSAGNLFCAATVTGTGVDTLTLSNVSVLYTPSTASVTAIGSGSTSATLTSGVTRYYSPLGNLQALSSEGMVQQIAPFAGTAAYLCAQVTANASTTTTTMVLRNNGVDTAVTYTIAGGATGSFVDTSNSVSVAAGDLLSIKGSGSDGTVTFRSMGLKFTAATATNYPLTAASGSFTLTGNAAGLKAARKVTAAQATFTLTGNATALKADRKLVAAFSAFTLTGFDASLNYSAGNKTLTAASGTFTLSGQAASLKVARTLSAASGAFVLTGNDAALTYQTAGYSLTAERGSFALTGGNVTFTISQFWTPVSPTSETWTPVAATSEIWTVQ